MAKFQKGIRISPNTEFRKGFSPWNKGKKGYKTKPCSEERKRKIGLANSISLKGRKLSEETKRKISLVKKGTNKGEKNWHWKGGFSINEVNLMKLEKIAGRKKPEQCEICGRNGRICFDHNHKTEKFRGWLCVRCNTALCYVEDEWLLNKLLEYIKKDGIQF